MLLIGMAAAAGCHHVAPRDYSFLLAAKPACAQAAARCDEGAHAAYCGRAGECAETGRAGPRDATAALGWFHKACARGDSESCWHAAALHLAGDGTAEDPAAGKRCAERACVLYFGFCEIAARAAEGTLSSTNAARDDQLAARLRALGASRVPIEEEAAPPCP